MNPYKLADKAILQLNEAALRRKQKAKSKLLIDGFDELNVIKQIDALYKDLDKNNRKKFKELWLARFQEVYRGVKGKDADDIEDLLEMHLSGLLEDPNDTTHYTYSAEVTRKRDRAKEAILSVPTRAQKQLMMDKHVTYFQQQTAWYADFTSQDAEITAYKEAGVKKVVRHEMDDDKVCSVCKAADGEVYDIDKIPPLPHLRCRRWFTPLN